MGFPKGGADNLWVDVRAELGTPDCAASHQLSVPMVNRAVPVVVMSRKTYAALESIPWFADYPHDSPRWVTANPSHSDMKGDE